jgi:putative CocE/NonD family hydrolase
VQATIYISTGVPDTDVTVKLLDVYPDGKAHNLSEGIARAKYRNSYSNPEPMEPGKVYALKVELFPTSNYFQPGHRIRVEVSSSDFPNFARNLNTMNSDTGTETRVAQIKIHHSREHPSSITLPVVPAGASRPWKPPLSTRPATQN